MVEKTDPEKEGFGDFLGNLPGGQIRVENDGVGMHNLLVHSSVKC